MEAHLDNCGLYDLATNEQSEPSSSGSQDSLFVKKKSKMDRLAVDSLSKAENENLQTLFARAEKSIFPKKSFFGKWRATW